MSRRRHRSRRKEYGFSPMVDQGIGMAEVDTHGVNAMIDRVMMQGKEGKKAGARH